MTEPNPTPDHPPLDQTQDRTEQLLPPTAQFPAISAEPVAVQQPQRSRTGLWITLGVVALVLCLGGGAGVGYLVYQNRDALGTNAAKPTPSAREVTPSAVPTSAAPVYKIKLAMPDKLNGLSKVDSPIMDALLEQVTGGLESSFKGMKGSAGVYGDLTSDMIMAIGMEGDIPFPETVFNTVVTSLQNGEAGMDLGDLQSVPPGPLGGGAKCGSAQLQGLPIELSVCVWTDTGSIGVLYFAKGLNAAMADFIKVRGEIETRTQIN